MDPRPPFGSRRPIDRPGGYRGGYPPPALDRPIGKQRLSIDFVCLKIVF